MSGVADDNAPDLTDPAGMVYWAQEKIRFQDVDAVGHVNNVAIATYAESGRVEMLTSALPTGLQGNDRPFWVIAELTIRFRGQAHYPGTVDVGTRVTRLGNSSITLGQGLFVDGRCIATTESVIVLVDPATGRGHALPPEVRDALAG